MNFKVEVEREEDGRWIAAVTEPAGVRAYGNSVERAHAKAQSLTLPVLADRLENGEAKRETADPEEDVCKRC